MTRYNTQLSLLLAALAAVAACASPGADDPDLGARVEPLVERAMERGLVPGLQVAVVLRDGRRWSGGFGVADMATGRLVDSETRFYIASTTKALTALAATRLHYRDAFDLDASLERHLPDVQFPDGFGAGEVTARDLLTHTHGLAQGVPSWRVAFTGEYTNQFLLDGLAQNELLPNRDFRYSNYGYDLAGVLLDPERTRGWKEVVEREVLQPLGMTHTTAYRSRVQDELIAMPHQLTVDGMERVPLTKEDANMGPAGGFFSTAADLGRLLLVQLNGGELDGEQVVPAEVVAETQRAQVPQQREFIHYQRHHWGLGWDIGTLEGETVIHRPGGFAGYYANAAFLPEHGFGVAVLTNGGAGSRFAEAVAAAIYDELLGRDDVVTRLDTRLDEVQSRVADIRERLSQSERPPLADSPTHGWDAYLGTYVSPTWGTAEVVRTEDGLQVRVGPMADALLPLRDEEGSFFTGVFDGNDAAYFRFNGSGSASELSFRGLEGAFVRQP